MSGRLSFLRWRVILLACLAALLLVPAVASADGDPGSDVLVAQNLFAPSTANLTPAQQLQIGHLLDATAKAGHPIRVALISTRNALGTVTSLWRKPQTYVSYLGPELSDTYRGPLLVIMPDGLGFYWAAKGNQGADQMATAAQHVQVRGVTGKEAVQTITAAVDAIESAAGVSRAELARDVHAGSGTGSTGSRPGPSAGSESGGQGGQAARSLGTNGGPGNRDGSGQDLPVGWLAVVVILLAGLYIGYRTGKLQGVAAAVVRRPARDAVAADARGDGREVGGGGRPAARRGLLGLGISPFTLLPTGFLAAVVIALVVVSGHTSAAGGGTQQELLAANPNVDSGSVVHPARQAANFTLYNQQGRKVSLKQYRGKVVILSFIDAECQTVCPLTSTAMLDAKRDLGPAAKHVQLLAVNANWRSNLINDVANYTQYHGMAGKWNFLTGTPKQLEKVWSAYGVNELKYQKKDSDQINHLAATYIIDPQGRLRVAFLTHSNYAAIPQFGQVLASDASTLLPGHPQVRSDYSYRTVKGITPGQSTTLPAAGGGKATLGPGKPRLYVFFDTWVTQTGTPIKSDLVKLNKYARVAKAAGLPQLTAVDVGSVEPDARALPAFLKSLPQKLDYPVAVDHSGRVTDGYDVEGEPWFVLTSATGKIVWYREVYTSSWPSLTALHRAIAQALAKVPTGAPKAKQLKSELSGSPAPLAALHRQSGELLSTGVQGLEQRIRALHGYPIVLNVWNSACVPCQKEYPLFQRASAQYGSEVAFLGVDNEDAAATAKIFLKQHPVSYPSYGTQTGQLQSLLPGGLQGTPTTIYINSAGKITQRHVGIYDSQGTLDSAIGTYALGRNGCTACG